MDHFFVSVFTLYVISSFKDPGSVKIPSFGHCLSGIQYYIILQTVYSVKYTNKKTTHLLYLYRFNIQQSKYDWQLTINEHESSIHRDSVHK